MDELKLSEEKIRKELVIEMILDELYRCLAIDSKRRIQIETYSINTSNLLYLLEKYDKNRFNAYQEMIFKEFNEND